MVAPAEVERVLNDLDDVAEAVVISVPAPDGGTRLAAYVAPERGASLHAWKLRRDIAAQLPSSMVPATFVVVARLPRTVRNQVDLAALPAPPSGPSGSPRAFQHDTQSEETLAWLFCEVLGFDFIGLDDDFFELGGDSLAVIELTDAIREHFGFDVAPSTVLEAPTVATLSPLMGERRPRGAPIVVELPQRKPRRATPVFFVGGGGAPTVQLRGLADAMGGRPFYGVQARGLEEHARPDYTVAAFARRAITEIRAAQPTGPYVVGGHSFGSLVAFEIAQRLVAEGDHVEALVLMDALAPPRWSRRPWERQTSTPRSKGTVLRHAAIATKTRAAWGWHDLKNSTAGLVPRRGLRQYDVFYGFSGPVGRRFQPKRHFDGHAVVVRAIDGEAFPGQDEVGPDLGWREWVTGRVTVLDAPGDHISMIRPPHVEVLARAIESAIAAMPE